MKIFEKVSQKITDTSKDMTQKAKAVADIAKLKYQIAAEEEKREKFFAQLGKDFFNDNSSNIPDKYLFLCNEISESTREIEKLRQKLYTLKGVKICENCGAELDEGYKFCGHCGTKLPEYQTISIKDAPDFIDEDACDDERLGEIKF
ncbi:MAG TPA: zinc ribbon domain-containing protein [Oscillospiraceae bacterium]|nr:zinc ribbon domain-containing protein [Oscillospiraceae bacterium]